MRFPLADSVVSVLTPVASDAVVRVVLVELGVALFKNVHFGEKELGVALLVDLTIHISEGPPHGRTSLLTELAVEHDDRAVEHPLTHSFDVA